MERVDCIVVGAGVVGLAVARACAAAGMETVVLESEAGFGTGTSSRNSEVVHAGIYYAPGSLKAGSCVQGRRRLYAYCDARGVAHRRCGKLLVATDASQLPALEALARRAAVNGLVGPEEALVPLTAAQARALEPEVACVAALWSPSTGIVDSHGLMLALLGDAEAAGASLACGTRFVAARRSAHGFVVGTQAGGAPYELACGRLVIAAGLHAQAAAARVEGLPVETLPPARWVKGSYFSLVGVRPPFSRLVYPMPNALGLGVHATIDLAGHVRFGPDTELVDRLDYDVDPARAAAFVESVRAFWPGLPQDALQPAYAGIRPKIDGPDADFAVHGVETHGVPGLVGLYGIESPGLTACLPLADLVVSRLQGAAGDAGFSTRPF